MGCNSCQKRSVAKMSKATQGVKKSLEAVKKQQPVTRTFQGKVFVPKRNN